MHEGDFTQAVVDHVLKTLEAYPQGRVKRVQLKTGEMLHIVQESVQFYYDLLTKDTNAAGAQVEVEEVPVRIVCGCGYDGGVKDHHVLVCPTCASRKVEVMSGKEIELVNVEIEVDAAMSDEQ